MLPREHGAYGQLLFPLGTALAISGIHPSGLLTAASAVAAFVAHEPLVLLLGGRGVRARREQRRRATVWLAISAGLAVAAGFAALAAAPSHLRWLFAWPAGSASVLAVLLLAKRERTTLGEITAAVSFASVAIPICGLAAPSPVRGFVVTFAFASLFIAGTLGVRIVVLNTRAGGDPCALRATRVQLAVAIILIGIGITLAGRFDPGASVAALAIVPGLGVAGALALHPPPARRLRRVGWTMLSTTAFVAAAIVAAFT
jgi:YwiC-like protein